MPLSCALFTLPERDGKLEACLTSDAAHIAPGARGDHVRKIQTALNALNDGRGIVLKPDGIYGPLTAAAVKAYKNAPQRRILQSWQTTADDIVGKGTIASLDAEMGVLEEMSPITSGFISSGPQGVPHDHTRCATPPRVTGNTFEGHADHRGTPINPRTGGLMINIYGEGETDYIGFRDFSAEARFANGRPLTQTLRESCASDICMRSAPMNEITEAEILRLALPLWLGGCRFTYASNQQSFTPPASRLHRLGRVIAQARIHTPGMADVPENDMECWVIEIMKT